MARWWWVLGLAPFLAGCAMCARSPYDECGPVYTGDHQMDCHTRLGSILEGMRVGEPTVIEGAQGGWIEQP